MARVRCVGQTSGRNRLFGGYVRADFPQEPRGSALSVTTLPPGSRSKAQQRGNTSPMMSPSGVARPDVATSSKFKPAPIATRIASAAAPRRPLPPQQPPPAANSPSLRRKTRTSSSATCAAAPPTRCPRPRSLTRPELLLVFSFPSHAEESRPPASASKPRWRSDAAVAAAAAGGGGGARCRRLQGERREGASARGEGEEARGPKRNQRCSCC